MRTRMKAFALIRTRMKAFALSRLVHLFRVPQERPEAFTCVTPRGFLSRKETAVLKEAGNQGVIKGFRVLQQRSSGDDELARQPSSRKKFIPVEA